MDGAVFQMSRPSWDEYFMANARLLSSRSTCDRLFVGCVLVKDNRIIGGGYNGSVAGAEHCTEAGHLLVEENGRMGCKRTIHAEVNAIRNSTMPVEGAIAYVTHYPCPDCMKVLNQYGVKEIVYELHYAHRYENDFDKGMKLREFTGREINYEWR